MGQAATKRLRPEARKRREQQKHQLIDSRKTEWDDLQSKVWSDIQHDAVVPVDETIRVFTLIERAKTQLNRGGASLTKSDLVAIALALDPTLQSQFESLNETTLSDLNCLIRTLVYDPKRVTGYSPHHASFVLRND